jgi:hypothetical protein
MDFIPKVYELASLISAALSPNKTKRNLVK